MKSDKKHHVVHLRPDQDIVVVMVTEGGDAYCNYTLCPENDLLAIAHAGHGPPSEFAIAEEPIQMADYDGPSMFMRNSLAKCLELQARYGGTVTPIPEPEAPAAAESSK